ncbi:MAG: type II CAAX endopeptidase family protein [Dehalococcoidales bacterium]|nr:type II CAAX endopeptidase family protein [Dehalococcoidales bacterium]
MIKSIFWNGHDHRLRALWRLLLFGVLLIVSTLVLTILLGMFLSFVVEALAAEAGTLGPVSTLLTLLTTLFSVWVAGRFLDRRRFADFGFRLSRRWWLDFGFGLALGAVLMLGIFLVELAAGWITITGTFQTAQPGQSFALALLTPIVVFLAVGFYEELLNRGYFLQNLAEGLNFRFIGPRGAVVLGWIISSALFGFYHAANPNATVTSSVNIAIAGLFLGLGYVLTGELALPIGLHITWNFFQGIGFGFPVSGIDFSHVNFIAISQGGPDLWTGGAFGPEAGLMGILAMVAGSLLILGWVRWRRGRISFALTIPEPPRGVMAVARPAGAGESEPLGE